MHPVQRPYPAIAYCRPWLVVQLCLLLFSNPLFSQSTTVDTLPYPDEQPAAGIRFFSIADQAKAKNTFDTSFWMYKGLCKATGFGKRISPPKINLIAAATIVKTGDPKRVPLIRVHGNVQYSFLYRSFVDTPFSQQDYQQHTVQTYLNILIKDKYPVNFSFSNRMSNSPYFRDFLDLNMQFDPHAWQRNRRQELMDKLKMRQFQLPDFKSAEAAVKQAMEKYNALKAWLDNPDLLQRLVEEREKAYYRKTAAARELPDSIVQATALERIQKYKLFAAKKMERAAEKAIDSSYYRLVQQKKTELDSLGRRLSALQAASDSVKNNIEKKLVAARQKIYKATRTRDLKQIESEEGLGDEKTKGIDRFLSDVKGFGIGRSVINYSELTAWNVSLTGLHVEYNPGIYTALAIGKIDYGFRDFMGRNNRKSGQNFIMGRIGFGDVDHKAIILSAFGGKKYNYGSPFIDTIPDFVNLAGYSVEAIWKKDEHTFIIAEVAKTTRPVTGALRDNNGIKTLFQFGNNANLGTSIKAQARIDKTKTDVSGFFRKTGENFQAFSLFTYNTDQTAWLLRVDQPFFREKLNISGILRRNDFVNPFSEKTFKTSTIFKSLQLTMRIPRWPVLSAGYLPGTQLYIVDRQRIRENAYYILNGSIMHNYSLGDLRMVSSVIYNRFAGKGTDSGFIAYSGTNYMVSQALLLDKIQLRGGYIFTDQEQMKYYTLEADADYSITKKLRLGGGARYNKILGGQTHLGSRAQAMIEMDKLGGFQLQYEKSYLPTIRQTLYPVETGRISWFKYF